MRTRYAKLLALDEDFDVQKVDPVNMRENRVFIYGDHGAADR